ncbi:MAG: GntR family transcriptional regulator [Actinobacteria bacterium]|nr:GntR family transcriptional regulator [Actinomycetota bacterium]MBL7123368.1 GntR family transcriptional regulator [Actinomycetota bacterium]
MDKKELFDQIQIDRRSGIPLYKQLILEIKRLLPEFRKRKIVFTEGEIEKKLNLSRNTVRQTMSKLVAEGLIIRERSRGIRIVEQSSKVFQESDQGLSFTDMAINMGKKPSVKCIKHRFSHPV